MSAAVGAVSFAGSTGRVRARYLTMQTFLLHTEVAG
jgi:hypothetical protein